MKKIYIVGALLLAISAGVVIGQSQGFAFAKDEIYENREGYHFERCPNPREDRRHMEYGNQDRHHKRGHMNHKSGMYNQRCMR